MSRVIHLYPQLMKCPYHVSFIQQQTLLASITRANNMLLIWFQEAVSRQLCFQLLSSGERTQNLYTCASPAGELAARCTFLSAVTGIQRDHNSSSSPNTASQSSDRENAAGFTGDAQHPQTQHQAGGCILVPAKSWGRMQQGRGPRTLLWAFTLLAPCPPPPPAGLSQVSTFLLCLQFCSTPNQQEDVWTGGTQVCSSLGSRGWNGAWSSVNPRPGLQECQSLTRVHGGTGGVNGGANQDPWCTQKQGAIEIEARLFCKDTNFFIFNHFCLKEK